MINGSLSTAMEYEQEKREEAINLAISKNIDPNLCSAIWNETVNLTAEEIRESSPRREHVMNFVFMGTSIKPRNIIINFSLKKLINFAIPTYLTTNAPNSDDEKIKWGLYILYKVLSNMEVKLSDAEVAILKYLHANDTYSTPLNEKQIYEALPFVNVSDINHLYQIGCIDIDKEKVSLKERVFAKPQHSK